MFHYLHATSLFSSYKKLKVDDVINRLKGTDCGGRGTSCPDQLAKALEAAKAQ